MSSDETIDEKAEARRAILERFEQTFEAPPPGMRFRDFTRGPLKERWGTIHRVRLGPRPDLHSGDVSDWCCEHSERWTCSYGNEVYYFRDADDAFHFKIRWAGQHLQQFTSY